jgi:lipopolysaccharide export system permease protein
VTVFDRYILNQIFPPLAATLLIALLILLVERMLRVLDLVLANSGPLHYVARMLAYLAPHYLGLALPFAFFLAILLTFNRLSRESEFDAFLAAGIGLHQLIRPLLMVTVGIFVIAAVIVNYAQPHTRYAYRALVSALKNPILYASAKEGVFISNDGVTFLVETISRDRKNYHGIFIYQDDAEGGTAVITAKRGALDIQSLGQPAIAHLYDGVRMALPKEDPGAGGSALHFDELRLSLGDEDYGPFRPRGRDEREFTLFELWQLRDTPPKGIVPAFLVSEFHARIVRLLSIIGLPFLAVSLALGRRRSGRFYGVAIGGGLLILYNEILDFGERSVAHGPLEPWLALWTPLVIFLAGSGFLFYRAAFLAGQPLAIRALERLADRIADIAARNGRGRFSQ